MVTAVRTVRLIQIAMLVSVVLYGIVGERVAGRLNREPANTLFHALSIVSISLAGATVVVRRTLVLPSEAQLKLRSDDNLAIRRWTTGYIFLYALCEVLGLFGFVLRMDGFPLANVWGFYLGAFLLLLLYAPRGSAAELS